MAPGGKGSTQRAGAPTRPFEPFSTFDLILTTTRTNHNDQVSIPILSLYFASLHQSSPVASLQHDDAREESRNFLFATGMIQGQAPPARRSRRSQRIIVFPGHHSTAHPWQLKSFGSRTSRQATR